MKTIEVLGKKVDRTGSHFYVLITRAPLVWTIWRHVVYV